MLSSCWDLNPEPPDHHRRSQTSHHCSTGTLLLVIIERHHGRGCYESAYMSEAKPRNSEATVTIRVYRLSDSISLGSISIPRAKHARKSRRLRKLLEDNMTNRGFLLCKDHKVGVILDVGVAPSRSQPRVAFFL